MGKIETIIFSEYPFLKMVIRNYLDKSQAFNLQNEVNAKYIRVIIICSWRITDQDVKDWIITNYPNRQIKFIN